MQCLSSKSLTTTGAAYNAHQVKTRSSILTLHYSDPVVRAIRRLLRINYDGVDLYSSARLIRAHGKFFFCTTYRQLPTPKERKIWYVKRTNKKPHDMKTNGRTSDRIDKNERQICKKKKFRIGRT